ncbi:NADH-quinone oxidoreductase subunit H [bacterium HR11]|nr:NADH-quinone oxidoreductase subunit H [bacterium HR11]
MERLLETLQRMATGEAAIPSALVWDIVFWFGLFLAFLGGLILVQAFRGRNWVADVVASLTVPLMMLLGVMAGLALVGIGGAYLLQRWGLLQRWRFAEWPRGVHYLILSLLGVVVVLVLITVLVLFLVWWERKISGHIQNRYGPTETGWYGLLQTLADGIKLLNKEDIIPAGADPILFTLAPCVIVAASFGLYAALPFSESLVIARMNVGLLWVVALGSLTVIGILMAGWAQNNKWALFGGMRSAAQVVSYEIPGGLALLAALTLVGSLDLVEIGRAQAGGRWLVWSSPFSFIAFLIYYIASLAETNRTPFDLPEAESELVAGYFTEYTSIRFSMFFLAEYANMFAVSVLAAVVFLGAWHGPVLPGPVWVVLKALALVFLTMLVRWTFPRFRVDQLMAFCWKFLIPLGFVCLLGNAVWALL